MESLSPTTQTRLLVLGLCVSGVAVVGLMQHMLIKFRDAAEIDEPIKPRAPRNTQADEDSIGTKTIEKLIQSHDFSLKVAASGIVFDRVLRNKHQKLEVIGGLRSPNYKTRARSAAVLLLLSEQSSLVSAIDIPVFYSSLVKCLEYCTTDYTHDPYDKNFDDFDFRDQCERDALKLVDRYISFWTSDISVRCLVESGFVQRWLAKEPWGKTAEEIQDNFKDAFGKKGSVLGRIILRIWLDENGLNELQKVGLVSKELADSHDPLMDAIDVRMINGEGTAGEFGDMEEVPAQEGDARLRTLSPEESNRRRRNREAMVLNDGTQPVMGSDIFERAIDSPDMEQPQPG